jgi:hypothetical protein
MQRPSPGELRACILDNPAAMASDKINKAVQFFRGADLPEACF